MLYLLDQREGRKYKAYDLNIPSDCKTPTVNIFGSKILRRTYKKSYSTVAPHLRAAALMETQHIFSKGHST